MKKDDDFDDFGPETLELNGRAKELKLFTMCLKKFIKKIFHHMVGTRFATWKDLAIHDQDGLAYPVYNYVLEAGDVRLRQTYAGYGLELEGGDTLLADLSVSAMLDEEGAIGLEFYLYETVSIVPYVCDDYAAVENEPPDMAHFRRINHADFEILYDELKTHDIFEDMYYELNKSILLIELSEREALAQTRQDSMRIITGIFSRARSISNLNTITNTDIKEFKLDFSVDDRKFSLVVLNGHDAANLPVYSSVLTMPEYKSVAQYVDLDTWYDKLIKVLRAKNINDPETLLLRALKPHDRGGSAPSLAAP